MSKKAFDLMPPYPQPSSYHHHISKAKKKKKKAQKTFFYFFFGLFFIAVVFILMKTGNGVDFSAPQNSTSGSTTSTSTPKFELFDNQGTSTLTGSQNLISVRLLNGGGNTNIAAAAKDLLLKAGFEIEKSENANAPYAETTIYYKKGQVTLAQQAADALKSSFTVQLQESSNLQSDYDLLIIVGEK